MVNTSINTYHSGFFSALEVLCHITQKLIAGFLGNMEYINDILGYQKIKIKNEYDHQLKVVLETAQS